MSDVLRELARIVGGYFSGNGELVVQCLRAVDDASEGSLVPLFRKKYLARMKNKPSCVLANRELASFAMKSGIEGAIVHEEPHVALARLIEHFYPDLKKEGGICQGAFVSDGAVVHDTAWIGPGAVVESGATIGEGSWIGPNSVICACARIGRYVRIGPCSVIGYEGFGFVNGQNGPLKLRQVGSVEIEDFVEIGACTCIDRGTLGKTVVGSASKLDNLVQVGHNARIGKGALIAAQSGIAGSTLIGDGAMLGGQSGIADHLDVGNGARIAAKSGVVGDVPSDTAVAGYPAMPHLKWRRVMAELMAPASRKAGSDTEDR